MHIEIKSYGLSGLWHDMLADSSVTSVLVVGVAALAISAAAWKIGRGLGAAKRTLARQTMPRMRRPRPAAHALAVAPAALARTLGEQWQRLDTTMTAAVSKAKVAEAAHRRAETLVDALDLEMSDLLSGLAGVSAYAGERTRPASSPVAPPASTPAASLAA